jgi:NfeD-like C-terminal, partner-binding
MSTTFPSTIQWFAEQAEGKVDQTSSLARSGRVKFQGSFWKAELTYPNCRSLKPGEAVKVLGRQGITLLVVPQEYELPGSDRIQSQNQRSALPAWTQTKRDYSIVGKQPERGKISLIR